MVVSFLLWDHIKLSQINPLYTTTGRKLNVHEAFRKRPGRLLNVLCTFSLRPVSTGIMMVRHGQKKLMLQCFWSFSIWALDYWKSSSNLFNNRKNTSPKMVQKLCWQMVYVNWNVNSIDEHLNDTISESHGKTGISMTWK